MRGPAADRRLVRDLVTFVSDSTWGCSGRNRFQIIRKDSRQFSTRSLEDNSSQNEFPRILTSVSILMDKNEPKNTN